jgi:hypothetical protein
MLTPPLQRFNDATIQRFNDPRGSRRVSRALSGVSPKSSASGLRSPLSPLSPFQHFSVSAFQRFSFPSKIPLQNPTAGIYKREHGTNAPFGFASAVATRVRSVAFAPCYATGVPMRFSQVQPSEPVPPTANCRNINMATISTDRLSLT